jgi:hypothetical protein
MIDLNREWFLESPLDFEHKKYTLLKFLESLKENRGRSNFPALEKIKALKKEIDSFLSNDSDLKDLYVLGGIKKDLDSVLFSSLGILKKYLESGNFLKREMKKEIRIHNLEGEEWDCSGIVIFHQIDSNLISAYWWKKTKIFFCGEEFKNIILKEIPLKNPRYSMGYEFIFHEAMEKLGIRKGNGFKFTFVEIPEKFGSDPEILSIAKEKFLENIP